MKLLKDAKADLTDELIDVVLSRETDDKEFDVGFYFGVKSVIKNEELSKAVGSLSYLIGEQEEKHYSEWYDCDKPNDIPTEELEEHAYKSIRILVDHFGA
jgi:hypothetical protein|tara:strand:- start:1250 stop:1549 length:300 start_codon:yes stop_codon:yes gene_type:complete